MADQPEEISGDFVRVATCSTPTEAHLLKGMLEAAGLAPSIADSHMVQANSWMTHAVGGVRVMVPASQVGAARQAISEFNDGAYRLAGEDEAPVAYSEQPAGVFSPDRAALLGFALTPAFPAAIQIANAHILGHTARRASQWVWLLLLGAVSLAGIVWQHQLNPGPFVAFRASFFLSGLTIVWYFAAGQNQSRMLLAAYGSKYKRRPLLKASAAAGAAWLGLGWVLSEFA